MSHQHREPARRTNEAGREAVVSTLGRRGVLAGLLGGTAALGGLGLAGAGTATALPGLEEPDGRGGRPGGGSPFVAKSVMPVNVKDHGAKGDGETDDSDAIQAAITAAEQSGGSVYFPAGTYVVSSAWRADGPVLLRGEGMWLTTIAVTEDSAFVDTGSHARLLVIEDIAFDNLGKLQTMLDIDGSAIHEFVFRRCRFTNLRSDVAVSRNGLPAVHLTNVGAGEFTDCLWHNPAAYAGQGMAVQVQGPPHGGNRLRFTGNNRFLWVNNGIRVEPHLFQHNQFADNPPSVLQYLEIDGAYLDGFWWLIPAAHAGEGSGVTYTATELADPGADFSNVDARPRPNLTNVRAMPVRQTGQVSTATANMLIDESADFITAGVKRMDIVRSSGRWAVVAVQPWAEAHPDAVQVEEWLDDDSLLPTDPPEPGADYVIYGVIVGAAIGQPDAKTLTIEEWRDLYGNVVLPEAGTRYEVMAIRPTYLLFTGPGGNFNMRLTNSTLRRGWADLAGIRGEKMQILGNLWEDGQESGCVIVNAGSGHAIVGNLFRHIGISPLFVNASEAIVIGNRTEGCWWRIDRVHAGDFWLGNGRRNHVAHNISVAGPETQGRAAAVTIRQDENPASGVGGGRPDTILASVDHVIEHNYRYGNDEDEPDVRLQNSGTIEKNKIIGARSIEMVSGATTAQLVETAAAGSPEGVYPATVGSTYRRTDGGPGETLYVKESGDGNTGWVAK